MSGTKRIAIISCCIWLLMADFLGAQQATISTDSMASRQGFRKTSLFPLPVVYYTPETRWAGG
ncbi:MAG: hypothetical protein IT269_12650, partial [Saprospiraceae bacterium]|nr:hypothetical protein [Saprospiraceae bacterium]